MRIISRKRLREFWEKDAGSESPLGSWYKVVDGAQWRNFRELRGTFPHADQVKVKSGNTVTVFNVGGNNIRLVGKVDYKKQIIFTLMVLTHEEYDKGKWKDQL